MFVANLVVCYLYNIHSFRLGTILFSAKLSSLNLIGYGWCTSEEWVGNTDGTVFDFTLNSLELSKC